MMILHSRIFWNGSLHFVVCRNFTPIWPQRKTYRILQSFIFSFPTGMLPRQSNELSGRAVIPIGESVTQYTTHGAVKINIAV